MRASSILCGFRSGSSTEPKFLIGSISRGFSLAPSSQPPELLVLKGTQSCLARGQRVGAGSSLPPSRSRFPAGCGPGKRPAPELLPHPPPPSCGVTRYEAAALGAAGGLGVHRSGLPVPPPLHPGRGRRGQRAPAAVPLLAGTRIAGNLGKLLDERLVRGFGRSLMYRIKGRGCMYVCICTYISI